MSKNHTSREKNQQNTQCVTFLCVSRYVEYTWSYECVHIHIDARDWCQPSITFHIIFEIGGGSLTEPGARLLGQASWLWDGVPISSLPVLRLHVYNTVPGFYTGTGDLNSAPTVCITSTFPADQLPRPKVHNTANWRKRRILSGTTQELHWKKVQSWTKYTKKWHSGLV